MDDPKRIAARVEAMRQRDRKRDESYNQVMAIRDGNYDEVAPGLFPDDFDKPLIANLIDTSARDVSEVMAPLPAINCSSTSMKTDKERAFAEKRAQVANNYVQNSRLGDQMYEGADRYVTFGFMAYMVVPDFKEKLPTIRVSDAEFAHYTLDRRGRTVEYAEVFTTSVDELKTDYPEYEDVIEANTNPGTSDIEVVQWFDDAHEALVILDPDMNITLARVQNKIGRCPVRVVQRPTIGKTVRGQFDDVIWVQIARAMVAMYTMNALEQSVNAPLVVPEDVNEVEMGPLSTLRTSNPQGVQRIPLNISPGLFPESQILSQEQRTGSRYPEGRSGNIDASIVTGQGVQALMGTFDTQVQTWQRLNASALEDVISMCFEMDQALWPGTKKNIRVKDNGSPVKITYTPSKDIDSDYTVDVSYGAIAGLDPNRGLVFLLQALSGGLISKDTSRRFLPVELNVVEEEKRINIEQMREALGAAMQGLPQAIPMMASQGQDPRQIVVQFSEVLGLVNKGKSIEDAVAKVFAPKEEPQQGAGNQPVDPMAQLMEELGQAPPEGAGAGGGAPGGGMPPGAGSGGGADLLMGLAGLTGGGQPNLQANVTTRQAV